MGSGFPLILMIIFSSFTFLGSHAQSTIKSPHLLDLIIRDYTFNTLDKTFKTGTPQSVKLPSANLSGITVDAARFRCGSLTRYGAQLKEFRLGAGVTVHPCIERVMLIRQNIAGSNWSSIYYSTYHLTRYKLVSPILGILAYNADQEDSTSDSNSNHSSSNNNNPFQLGISCSDKSPLTIDFSFTNVTKLKDNSGTKSIMCASFEGDGRMTLAKPSPISSFTCVAKRHGHFGLVVESSSNAVNEDGEEDDGGGDELKKPISQWKVAVGSTIGAALGAFLLGLLLVAMLVRVKKRSRMVEMERRAYEEEALQVSMVGHVRAPTASGTRTTPVIEHDYNIPRQSHR